MKFSLALAISMAGISTAATAQTERDLDSHEHGAAILNVAVDDGAVFLELESPWNNLVGFEHTPTTDEQKALVSEAVALLVQPESLFTFNGGDCSADDVSVESGMDYDQKEGEHDDHHDDDKHDDGHHDDDKHDDGHHDDDKHHDDDHHDDDKHHDDDHHDDDKHHDDGHHDDDKHHDEHEGETHSSALGLYSYKCTNVSQLSAITVNIFSLWSGFEELHVQLIGPGGQTGFELTAEQTTIDLTTVQ